jgi:hypothetical protein
MALTLTEAAKFSRNMLKKGVYEEIIKDSVVLQKLPFMDVMGNAYEYMVEQSLAGVQFFDPNEVWTESTGSWTKRTAVLRILGGDADVDNFLAATRSDINDLRSEVIDNKAKAVKHTFLSTFYYGSNAANPKAFDGLQILLNGTDYAGQRVNQGSGSTPAALSIAKLEQAMDLILDGMPDALLMSRTMRRRLNAYIRSTGSGTGLPPSQYGARISEFGNVDIHIDDFITNTETISGNSYAASTGGSASSIYIVRFGQQDVVGFQNGGLTIRQVSKDLESKDGSRTRVKWYVSLGIIRKFSAAVIDGIDSTTAVVA